MVIRSCSVARVCKQDGTTSSSPGLPAAVRARRPKVSLTIDNVRPASCDRVHRGDDPTPQLLPAPVTPDYQNQARPCHPPCSTSRELPLPTPGIGRHSTFHHPARARLDANPPNSRFPEGPPAIVEEGVPRSLKSASADRRSACSRPNEGKLPHCHERRFAEGSRRQLTPRSPSMPTRARPSRNGLGRRGCARSAAPRRQQLAGVLHRAAGQRIARDPTRAAARRGTRSCAMRCRSLASRGSLDAEGVPRPGWPTTSWPSGLVAIERFP